MKKALLLMLTLVGLLASCVIVMPAQKDKLEKVYKNGAIRTVELYSPYDQKSSYIPENSNKSCLNLLTSKITCDQRVGSFLTYGRLRVGAEWDWLDISMSRDAQTRMVKLGKKTWEEPLKLSAIKLWWKLKPGEERHISVSANGANGVDGVDGVSAPGSRSPGGLSGVIPTENISADKSDLDRPAGISTVDRKTGYDPFLKAVQGEMYLVRVFDEANDYYILFRIDELVRGTKCVISWRKLDIPAERRPPKY